MKEVNVGSRQGWGGGERREEGGMIQDESMKGSCQ